MITVLYRINSKEVVKISLKGQTFSNRDTRYWGVLSGSVFPDGIELREQIDDNTWGPLRQLGYSKYVEEFTNTVRNATQEEINNFSTIEESDNNQQDADEALKFFNSHPRFRKAFKAFLNLIINEVIETSNRKINEMINQWNQYKQDISNANSLTDIKTYTASLPDISSNLKETATLTQVLSKIETMINKDD